MNPLIKYLNKYKNIISSSYMLAFLGLFLLLYYFYIRVIMERIPRDIPFSRTIYSFIFLLCIIFVHLYVLFRIYYPANPPVFLLRLLPYIQKLYVPFYALDEFFRANLYTKKVLERLYVSFGFFSNKLQLYSKQGYIKYLYFSFVFAPRFVLLFLLIFDIMYFTKIEYLYYFSILLFIPLIFQYFVHLMKKILEEKINYLDENFYVKITSKNLEDFDFYSFFKYHYKRDGLIKTRSFIENQIYELSKMYDFVCIETEEARDSYAKKIGLSSLPFHILNKPNIDKYSVEIAKEFYKWIYPTIFVGGFINAYEFTVLHYQLKEKYQRLIFAGYLFCWSYIFAKTFLTLDLLLELIIRIKPPDEPFF